MFFLRQLHNPHNPRSDGISSRYNLSMNNIDNLIQIVAREMVVLRQQIHSNPEPAFEERETAALIAAKLETISGIDIHKGVAKTGIVAVIGGEKKGPCLGLRADMDCLRMQEANDFPHVSQKKGLMHGCGHDGHIVCLLGAALVLGEIQGALNGPVKCIFQPAEENYGGAHHMVKEGALHDPEVAAIFGLHGTPGLPLGQVGVSRGPAMAVSKYFKIIIQGKGAHAAMPHLGIDPVVIGAHIICGVQAIIARNINPLEAGLISIPKFSGSTAPNVIPEKVEMEGTLRALSNTTRDILMNRLQKLVEETASAHGGSAEVIFDSGYPLLENNKEGVEYFCQVAESVVGKEKLVNRYPATLGAEDFAFYSEKVPGVFWWLGLKPEDKEIASLHNPNFDFNDEAIPLAIEMHCKLVLKFNQIMIQSNRTP